MSALSLPEPGCWALGLGVAATALAEQLQTVAQRQSLTVAWLSPELNFLSNLTLLDNLRLMHDWDAPASRDFAQSLQRALTATGLEWPQWLAQRPSQLSAAQLSVARFLRVLVMQPALLVLHPDSLQQAEAENLPPLPALLPAARIVLLGEARAQWPAWVANTRFMGEASA